MRPNPWPLAIALAALLALPLAADDSKEKASPRPESPAAGMKAHVDPATGQLVSPKSDPRAATAATALESAPVARTEKVTTKAGGMKLRLDDRHRMEMTVAVGPDGKLIETCREASAPVGGAAKTAEAKRDDR